MIDYFEIGTKIQDLFEEIDESNLQEIYESIASMNVENDKLVQFMLLSRISTASFTKFKKIEIISKILEHYCNIISKTFSSDELMSIFKNRTIIYILLKNNLIDISAIYEVGSINFFKFFCKEIYESKVYHENDEKDLQRLVQNLDDNHDIYCRKGVSINPFAKIIREDDIDTFQEYVSQNNIRINGSINTGVYESCNLFAAETHEVTIIDYAAYYGSINIFKFLIMNGARVTNSTKISAIVGGNLEIIHILEQENSAFNQFCLTIAIIYNQNDIFDYLISNHGLEIAGDSLKQCIKFSNFSIFNIIFQDLMKKHDINTIKRGLMEGCKRGALAFVENILNNLPEININEEYSDRHSYLTSAAIPGNDLLFRYLCENYQADINIRCSFHQSSIHIAALNSNIGVLKYLIEERQFNINDKDSFGSTALHLAAKHKKLSVVKYLLTNKNINVNALDSDKCTALRYAVYQRNDEIAIALLNHPDINYNEKGPNNQNILHIASRINDLEIVKVVSQKENCNINQKGVLGYTALHWAAQEGYIDIIAYLTSLKGIDLNPRDKNNYTPLIKAAEMGKTECVKHLLSLEGVDVFAETAEGQTALSIAKRRGFKVCVQLIEEYVNSHS